MHALLSAWKKFQPKKPPYVLPGDEIVLDEADLCCRYAGWKDFVTDPEFEVPRVIRSFT